MAAPARLARVQAGRRAPRRHRRRGLALLALLVAPAGCGSEPAQEAGFDVLVFTRTEGFRHESIGDGVKAIRELGGSAGFTVTHTEDPAAVAAFDGAALVFLHTTRDVLEPPHEAAVEQFVREGGGWVGVHAAADTEYGWPFMATLLGGARFRSHPPIQRARIEVEDRRHPSTRFLPSRWTRTDEWYAFRASPRPGARVLLSLDERTYDEGTSGMGGDHPVAWCRDVGRGRAWYTALGHTRESYAEPRFRRHLLGGILSAARRARGSCAPAPRIAAPVRVGRRVLRRRGLPVVVTCPRACTARLRLAGARRRVRLAGGRTARVRLRPRRAVTDVVRVVARSGTTRQVLTVAVY